MKLDNNQHVIVSRAYGEFQAYACTVENARTILEEHLNTLPHEVSEIASMLAPADKAVEPVAARLVEDALAEVLGKQPGEESQKLRRLLYGARPRDGEDTRPQAIVTAEAQQELVMWLFKHGMCASPLDKGLADRLNELHPETQLAMLAPFASRMGKPVHYVRYPDYFEAARTLGSLRANRWKEDAAEHLVVERHLAFVREWLVDTNDVTYVVTTLATAFK